MKTRNATGHLCPSLRLPNGSPQKTKPYCIVGSGIVRFSKPQGHGTHLFESIKTESISSAHWPPRKSFMWRLESASITEGEFLDPSRISLQKRLLLQSIHSIHKTAPSVEDSPRSSDDRQPIPTRHLLSLSALSRRHPRGQKATGGLAQAHNPQPTNHQPNKQIFQLYSRLESFSGDKAVELGIQKAMIILLTADPFIPVPPIHYGGIERVIHMLIDGYVANGHQVHLLAHKDSNHPLVSSLHAWPKENPVRTEHLQCIQTLRKVVRITEPDVIHSFCRLQYILGLRWSTKVSCSVIREISVRTTGPLSFFRKPTQLCACGAHMIESRGRISTMACGTLHGYRQTRSNEQVEVEHYVFLGRMNPSKARRSHPPGPAHAHPFASQGTSRQNTALFRPKCALTSMARPSNTSERSMMAAAVVCRSKSVFDVDSREEPFGIVMAEALSCGVPILALNRGSVPEIVKDYSMDSALIL